MGYGVTVFFYIVIGIGVALALWVGDDTDFNVDKRFQIFTAPFFWPIYIPLLLTPRKSPTFVKAIDSKRASSDAMGQLISQVETELATALRSLDGWAENVLAGEQDRIAELRTAWRQQAGRIRELDQLLTLTPTEAIIDEASTTSSRPLPVQLDNPDAATFVAQSANLVGMSSAEPMVPRNEKSSRIAACERTRQENILKLRCVRTRLYDDLMATLSWVRELVTMIHLAKYTGAPASRAEELVKQIAAAVEGLSDVVHHNA